MTVINPQEMVRAVFIPSKKDIALQALAYLTALNGEGRYNNRPLITRILALYDLPFSIDGTDVSFCCATIGWLWCKALAVAAGETLTDDNAVEILKRYRPVVDHNYFHTGTSVTGMIAANSGMYVKADRIGPDFTLLPGWAIAYRFSETDWHMGLIARDGGDTIMTEEANTVCAGHSGMIGAKSRTWEFVDGFFMFWTE